MTKVLNRMMVNICAKDLAKSKHFYTRLLAFDVDYDSDWFIHLISKGRKLELGIIDVNSEIVPKQTGSVAGGSYITFVIDNVDEVYAVAKAENFKILLAPENTFYGQRRMLLEDPDGMVIDISAPIERSE